VSEEAKGAGILGCLGVIFVVVILGMVFSLKIVGAGEIGVATNFGAINHDEKGPGVNIVLPFFTDVHTMDGRIQAIKFENLAAASKEYQDVFLTGTLNVHIKFDQAAELYQSVGDDYKDKLVIPYYTNIVKEIVPQYAIGEILPKREEIRKQTVERLQAKLAPYGIEVDDVALANINFNEGYNAAIQDKQVQELKVQTERNILEQKKIQKDQAIVQAQAEAQAQIERAKGEAEANRLISQSLTDNILRNRYIEKLADDVKVVFVPSDSNMFFDTKSVTNP
jgi:regulator of protease activity HflC (stomatin/prohibitin superfamily)